MTKLDPYAHLSVPRDAPPDAIRRAYRRRAKSDHPDSPTGSSSKFSLTKLSHDILSDAARRARYDATGDASETSPDNAQAEIYQTIMQLFDAVCAEESKLGRDPLTLDLAAMMRQLCAKNITAFKQQRAQTEAQLAKALKFVGRFKKRVPKGANKPTGENSADNLLDTLITGRLTPFHDALRMIDARIALFEKSAAILADYDFTADAPAQAGASTREDNRAWINLHDILSPR
jgi:curved DNA-binding protein CbpA